MNEQISRAESSQGANVAFGEAAKWQSWLDVEAALALSQAELGIIPRDAGPNIAEKAKLDTIGVPRLKVKIQQTMAPVYALSECLAEACGPDGDYVHWGATTQNIVETGRLLVLKQIQAEILQRLDSALRQLCNMATEHAGTIMVGRTNRQNALPITFGFKVAGWIDELLRVRQQLLELEPRLFQLRFGGAVGGFHSLGAEGLALSSALADRLQLYPSLVPNRTSTDPLIEYVTRLSMIGVCCSRLSDELYLLMTEEIAEVQEMLEDKVVGSSTMPHKVNPKYIVELSSLALQLRAKGAAAFSVPSPSHEGDTVTNRLLGLLVEESCRLSLSTIQALNSTLTRISPDVSRMRANYQGSREMMATESLMMALAPSIGRGAAHDRVHALVAEAKCSGRALVEVLNADKLIVEALGNEIIAKILGQDANAGQCETIVLMACSACEKVLAGNNDSSQ